MTTITHAGAEPLELIDTKLSGNGWKVRLMAGYLNIPLKRTSLSIVDGDLEDESFALINPVRQVPVLRTREGRWLSESPAILWRSEEHTSELKSLMRISYAVFCLKKQTANSNNIYNSVYLTSNN